MHSLAKGTLSLAAAAVLERAMSLPLVKLEAPGVSVFEGADATDCQKQRRPCLHPH
jgi:hypothetical protein